MVWMVNQHGVVEKLGVVEELVVLGELKVPGVLGILPTRVTAWCNSQAGSVPRLKQFSRKLRRDVIRKQSLCRKRQFSRELRHGVVNAK